MGDSYRPNRRGDDRYRRRDYQDFGSANSVGYDSRRRRGSDRSRSPPRRLNYDEGPAQEYDSYSYGYATRGDPRPPPRPYYGEDEPPPPSRGEKDATSDPTIQWHFILVRNLKHTASEAIFAKGLEKLDRSDEEGSIGALPGGLKRVLLIRDRRTDDSMGYGFAEYHNIADAKMAVQKAKTLESRGQLTISSMDVTVEFPHLGVFPPDGADGRPDPYDKFKFTFRSGLKHIYHDKRYYASTLDVNIESPYAESIKQASGDEKKKSAPKKKAKDDATLDGFSRKRKAPGTAAPPIFNIWSQKQAELRGEHEGNSATPPPATGVNAVAPVTFPEETDAYEPSETFAYEHNGSVNCYLCMATFQSKEKIRVHLRDSTKHAHGLENEETVAKAHIQLKAKGLDTVTSIRLSKAPRYEKSVDSTTHYHDRAAERRQRGDGTGSKSEPMQKVGFSLKDKRKKGPSTSSSDNEASSKPAFGLGSKMLAKHGWSDGQGLGKGGEGMTAALETNVYASGVGLGHEESKKGDAVEEAQKATMESNKGYAEAGRDRQWKRYYDQ